MKPSRVIWIFVFMLTSLGISVAQEVCPQLVEDAIESLGNNCDGLGRNTACYGYFDVSAEFSEEVEPDYFTTPADTTDIDILELLEPSVMNTIEKTWGIAVMNLQANIPNSVPGQTVKLLLLGDTSVEGDIESEEAFEPVNEITVTANGSFDIIHRPIEDGKIYDTTSVGDSINIDAQTPDDAFYRVVGDDYVGWIPAEAIDSVNDLSELPILDGEQRGLMQSFYLRSGVGTPQCDEAPQDSLIIQSPERMTVELTVNGAQVRLGSTVRARILPDGDTLEFLVIDGNFAIIGAGSDGGDLEVPVDHKVFACLDEATDTARDGRMNDRPVGCEWSQPEPIGAGDLDGLCPLENLPAGILNYSLDLDCDEPIVTPTPTTSSVTNSSGANSPVLPSATFAPTDVPIIEDNNLCYEGNAWGDGRCKTDYDWQAGFYYGQLEAGLINLDDIPEPFYIAPTAIPVVDIEDDGGSRISVTVFCGPSPHEYNVTIDDAPVSETSFLLNYIESDSGTPNGAGPTGLGATFTFTVIPPDFPEDVFVISSPNSYKNRIGNLNCP